MAGNGRSPGLNRSLSNLFHICRRGGGYSRPVRSVVVFAVLALAACSLEAPPPAAPASASTSNSAAQQGSQSADGTAEASQATGLAPAPSDVSEETHLSPNSPVNFVALTPVPMALIWYGRTDLNDVDVIVSKAGTASRFEFGVPSLDITCQGLLRFEGAEGYGEWQMVCSDASEAAGILVPVAGQATINGQGVDLSNRSVLFSIPLRN